MLRLIMGAIVCASLTSLTLAETIDVKSLGAVGDGKTLDTTIIQKAIDQATLQRTMVKLRSDLYDSIEQFNGFGRADLLCSFALFDDDPGRINHLEEQFAKITPEMIQKTAQQYLQPSNRTVLVVGVSVEPVGAVIRAS